MRHQSQGLFHSQASKAGKHMISLIHIKKKFKKARKFAENGFTFSS